MTVLLCTLGVLIPYAAPVDQPAKISEVRKAIDEGNAQYIRSFKDASAAGVAGVYDKNGSRLERKGVALRGREAIQADLEKFIRQTGPITATVDTTDLWVVDDIA